MNDFIGVIQSMRLESAVPAGASPFRGAAGVVVGYVLGADDPVHAGRVNWDPVAGCIEISRPPCGGSAIYYMRQARRIVFASSLQALLALCDTSPEVEEIGLVDVLMLGRVLPPYTLYRGILCVPAGHRVQFLFEGRQSVVRIHNECDLALQIGERLDSLRLELDSPGSTAGERELLLDYDAEFAAPLAQADGEQLAPAAADIFDAIPAAAGIAWQPLGDAAESAFAAAIPDLKHMQPLTIDLGRRLVAGLFAAPAALPAFDFLATKKLRKPLQHWREQREPLLWQPVDRLARRLNDARVNRLALFRLLHLLPERRQCLNRIAAEHRLRLTFRCADSARLARQVVRKLKGAAPPAIVPMTAQTPVSLASARFPLEDQGYANPYQRAVMLSQQKCVGVDDVNRFFHLQAWPMLWYRKLRDQAIGPQLEQRLCAILSIQYLLNFSSPRAK